MKRTLFITFFLALGLSFFYSDSYYNQKIDPNNLILKIELVNPKIYRQNEDIYLDVKIINISDKNISTFITDDKKFTFDFEIYTMQNQTLEHKREYIVSFHKVQTIFKFLLNIEPMRGIHTESNLTTITI